MREGLNSRRKASIDIKYHRQEDLARRKMIQNNCSSPELESNCQKSLECFEGKGYNKGKGKTDETSSEDKSWFMINYLSS